MRQMVLALALLGMTAAAGFGTEPTDLEQLQGNWKPLTIKYDDQEQMPPEMLKQMTGVYDGSEFHLYFVDKGRDGPRPLKLAIANVTLGPTTTPKTIAFEFARGPLKGRKLHGIYELKGDLFWLCYGPVEKPRPTTFESPKGSGYFREEWQRKKK